MTYLFTLLEIPKSSYISNEINTYKYIFGHKREREREREREKEERKRRFRVLKVQATRTNFVLINYAEISV